MRVLNWSAAERNPDVANPTGDPLVRGIPLGRLRFVQNDATESLLLQLSLVVAKRVVASDEDVSSSADFSKKLETAVFGCFFLFLSSWRLLTSVASAQFATRHSYKQPISFSRASRTRTLASRTSKDASPKAGACRESASRLEALAAKASKTASPWRPFASRTGFVPWLRRAE